MKAEAIYRILSLIYQYGLRDLILRAIDDPNESWDEVSLRILDSLFSYDEKK